MEVRRMLHRQGYRYRLHSKNLPGRPDIVFTSKRKAIFVHGCFWHGHGCQKGKLPKSKLDYWKPKIDGNKARDAKNVAELEAKGWKVLIIWQCELTDSQSLCLKLKDFMES